MATCRLSPIHLERFPAPLICGEQGHELSPFARVHVNHAQSHCLSVQKYARIIKACSLVHPAPRQITAPEAVYMRGG